MIRWGSDTVTILNSFLRVVASISNSIGAVRDTEQMPSAQWGDLTARGQYLSPIFPGEKEWYKTGNTTLTKSLNQTSTRQHRNLSQGGGGQCKDNHVAEHFVEVDSFSKSGLLN